MAVRVAYDKPTHIYVIIDEAWKPVYVGATVRPLSWRLSMHRSFARRGGKSRFLQWLAGYLEAGLTPRIIPLETVPAAGDWMSRESAWIAEYRSRGFDLLNETAGGIGLSGRSHSTATKEKMSAWQKGKPKGPMPQETKDKIGVTLRGRPFTEEHKQRIGEGLRGRSLSEESRKKIAASLRAYNERRKEGSE